MMEYLKVWQFWVSVVVVAIVINYAWTHYLGGKANIA